MTDIAASSTAGQQARTAGWLPHALGAHGSRMRDLLTPLPRTHSPEHLADRRPGAIVVPTSRAASGCRSGLSFAARLAVETGAPLVVLASKDAAADATFQALEQQITVAAPDGPRLPDTLVLVPSAEGTDLTSFETSRLPISTAYRRGGVVRGERKLGVNDVGRKRNLALLLAAGQGWRSVLFLDDDVFACGGHACGWRDPHQPHENTLDPDALRAAAQAVDLDGHLAVGWAAQGYDDNSVLCRIAAETGAERDQFIGGGALLVHVDDRVPFFPTIYNEDWLFILGLLERRSGNDRRVFDGGEVHQDAYFGFGARRAAAEELGDILGEGLLALLRTDAQDVLSRSYWRHVLRERYALLGRVHEQVMSTPHPHHGHIVEALQTVAGIHRRLRSAEEYWAQQCATFVETWRADMDSWRHRLRLDDVPAPTRLVRSREMEKAVALGSSGTPEAFLRRHAAYSRSRRLLPVGA